MRKRGKNFDERVSLCDSLRDLLVKREPAVYIRGSCVLLTCQVHWLLTQWAFVLNQLDFVVFLVMGLLFKTVSVEKVHLFAVVDLIHWQENLFADSTLLLRLTVSLGQFRVDQCPTCCIWSLCETPVLDCFNCATKGCCGV